MGKQKINQLSDLVVPRRPRSCRKRRLSFEDSPSCSNFKRRKCLVADSSKSKVNFNSETKRKVKTCMKMEASGTGRIEEQKNEELEQEENHKHEAESLGPMHPSIREFLSSRRANQLRLDTAIEPQGDVNLQVLHKYASEARYTTRTLKHFSDIGSFEGECETNQPSGCTGQYSNLRGQNKTNMSKKRRVNTKDGKSKLIREWKDLLKESMGDRRSDASSNEDTTSESDSIRMRGLRFIVKVGSILGPREFLPWKGSVLDSVVGAFLTQRVSDTLSRSAFMALAAYFPQGSECGAYSKHHRMLRAKRSKTIISPHRNPTCGVTVDVEKERKRSSDVKTQGTTRKGKKKKPNGDWIKKRIEDSGDENRERSINAVDYVDWISVWRAPVKDVSRAISHRGMSNTLGERIKNFLDRLVMYHGNLDLEWLRKVPPEEARNFLLSIRGLGLKTTDCVLLLCLRRLAFPVDVNVARITVRLGWVPLLLVGDEVQMNLLGENSKLVDMICEFLRKQLDKLDHNSLYNLHFLMITFGKVFCTKQKPKCAECPMRKECKYYSDTVKRTECELEPFELKDIEDSGLPDSTDAPRSPKGDRPILKRRTKRRTPHQVASASDEQLKTSPRKAVHFVYEIPDWHPILETFDEEVDADGQNLSKKHPYLLLTYVPAEGLCDFLSARDSAVKNKRSSSTTKVKRSRSKTVPGTVLIPCQVALKGKFPLNGTYFQPNEVFADHETSKNPRDVPCEILKHLQPKPLYFGTELATIVRDFSGDEIKRLFREGYFCTKEFDRQTSRLKPLQNKFYEVSLARKRKEPKQNRKLEIVR